MLVVFMSSVAIARLGVAVVPLGLFFAAARLPSDAHSLVLASWPTTCAGLALWPFGRLLDRWGCEGGLRASLLAGAAAWSLSAAAVAEAAPMAVQLTAVGVARAVSSPVVLAPRAVLPALVPTDTLGRASGLEAASYE